MKSEWTILPLSECVELIIDYRGKTPKKLGSDWSENGYRALSAKNIKTATGIVQEDTIRRVDNELYKKWMKEEVCRGDILMTSEAPLGELFLWNSDEKIVLSQRLFALRPNENLDSTYLFYYMTTPKYKHELESRATGTTVVGIKQTQLVNTLVEYPNINTQKKIAHILSTLDDKIELNRKMNQTLEEMASAIFKSWFVDFDPVHAKANCTDDAKFENIAKELGISKEILDLFPSEFEESELGMIPKGWEVKRIDKISSVSIGKTPPRKEPHWFTTNPNDIKWVSIKDMGENGAYLLTTNEYLTEDAINKHNVKVIPANTVLLSFKLTLGRLSITSEEMTSNEAIAHFKLEKNSILTSEFIYCYLKDFDYNKLGSTSSIATAINSQIVKTIPILVPDKITVNKFQNIVHPLFQQMLNHNLEIKELQKTRDILLPKLLSGEIDVSEIEVSI